MIEVIFADKNEVPDELLEFAVILTKYNDNYVFCRHKQRSTWEIPGGHREPGETIEEAAERELGEETGAVKFEIAPVTVYGVKNNEEITYGMLFFANVVELGDLPDEFEIGELFFSKELPQAVTYPEIYTELWRVIRKEL